MNDVSLWPLSLTTVSLPTSPHSIHTFLTIITMSPVAAIVGAGPGNGAAFAARFLKEGYSVAVLSRSSEAMETLAKSLGSSKAKGYACNVTSDEAVNAAFANIQKDLGPVSTVIFNAGPGGFKPIEQWKASEITSMTDINAAGLYRVATAAKPQLLQSDHQANIVVIGAGAATRGRPATVGFAAAKAAQRSVAQSLARAWGPEKIHVSYMIIDGVIDGERARSFLKDKPDDFFLKSEHIADAIVNVVNQESSAWTFEFDIRPFGETW